MTNGEKIQQDFKGCEVCEPIVEDDIIHVIFADKKDSAIGFDWSWWNAEYEDPTTKNDLGVDREDAVERLNAIKQLIGYDKDSEIVKATQKSLNMAIKALEQEPRWIPVSEYLPVTNDEVLVTYIVNGNTKKRYVETANCFDGEWSSVNDEYRIPNTKIEIIAWCEMPKPYREVEE